MVVLEASTEGRVRASVRKDGRGVVQGARAKLRERFGANPGVT